MNKKLKYPSLLSLSLLLVGCLAEEVLEEGRGKATGDETLVTVTLRMPATTTPAPDTYAISVEDENEVATIDVLVFKPNAARSSGWEFAYKTKGNTITDQSGDNPIRGKKKFDVRLLTDEDNLQKLVILANVRNQIEVLGELSPGTDKDELLGVLVFANAGSWNANNDNSQPVGAPDRFLPFPMWGEVTADIRKSTTQISGVTLLRGIARMDVVLANAVTGFELNEIYVYNSKNKGQIVPAVAHLDGFNARVKMATVPDGAINNITPLRYEVPAGMERVFERTIYLFEARGMAAGQASEATCLVAGGTFASDTQTTYYRIDFFRKDAEGNDMADYDDVLRNHRYRIYITAVSGSGYKTAQEAFDSRPLNMKTEIKAWDDSGMTDVLFDEQYMLAVGPSEFSFFRDALPIAMEKNRLSVYTDHPLGWKIEEVVDAADGITPVSWLSVQDDTTGTAEVKKNLWLRVGENNTGNERTAHIVINAGRLRHTVVVKQSIDPGAELLVLDPLTGKEISGLLFTAPKDAQPAARQFSVQWNPVSASPSITTSLSGNNPAFTFQTGSDVIVSGHIPAGAYQQTFTVFPTPIMKTDLTDNPFMERVTRVEYTVTNESKTATRSLFLRQLAYNLIYITENFYSMDGGEYSFTVKSNYPWKAEIIQWGDQLGKNVIAQLITTSGAANTNTGINVRFRTVNDLSVRNVLDGTAKIKFTNLYDETVTETVSLYCLTGIVLDESNTYMVNPGGYPILIPVSRANAGGVTRIGTGDTYTADLLWTDHPGGVKYTTGQAAAIDRIFAIGTGDSGLIQVVPGAQEGNSVIAARVGAAVKWSWHIWTTAYTTSLYDDKYVPLQDPLNTKNNNGFVFMDRNIGGLTGYNTANMNPVNYSKTGLMYQWGRKDPMPTGVSDNNERTLYNATGTGSTNRILKASGGSLELSIAYPSTFYFRTTAPNDWYSTSGGQNANLWNSTMNQKTVYDPCPKGWRVPRSGTGTQSPWSGLSVAGLTWNKGYTWTNAGYYAAIGYRVSTTGVIANVGVTSEVWAANTSSTNAYAMRAASNSINPSYAVARACGFSVRCVRE